MAYDMYIFIIIITTIINVIIRIFNITAATENTVSLFFCGY